MCFFFLFKQKTAYEMRISDWSSDVCSSDLICGEEVVLYRKTDGQVVAMHDGCPHRLVPLSMGMIEGDNIRCKYHGMLFDGEGRCLQAPGKDASLDRKSVV